MVIVIVIPRCCMYGIIAYIWRKCMVNALVDILCMEHTGYLLYKPTSCCFPLQAFFLYPFFTHGLPGMCVPWRAPFGSPRWTSRVHPGQRLLRFVTWDDERNFMTQSTRFATNVLFFMVLYTWTPPRMQACGKFEGSVWDFKKLFYIII